MPTQPPLGAFPGWDDFRFFLAVNEAGSFSKAAGNLGVTQPTISRRIEHLEQQLGVRLFDRLPDGVALTSEGAGILDAAREIEDRVLDIQRSILGSDRGMEGSVRISVTDGLATYWMTPQLPAFQDQNPGISIEFNCSVEPADALRMETDLSIRFRKPEEADLVAVKLGTLHFVLWASPAYLERHGAPKTAQRLLHHRLLDHAAYYGDEGEWSKWLTLARAANLIIYRTNSSASMLSAIQNGLGIGLLPTYICETVAGIVPLSLDVRTYSNMWLTYHPDLREMPRMRVAIDWVRSLFDEAACPWFRDTFHPPRPPSAGKPSGN
jgi:DNA-binding transcriptional LysR family regulator